MTIHDRRSNDTLAAGQYAPVEIDDPYERGAKNVALRQLRCDPLARLHTHHQIDDAQFAAGRAYQRDKEVAERGARAIDPTKEAVDGGLMPEALTDRQIKARKRIIKIERELGRRLTNVLEAILVDGKTVEQLANSRSQAILKLHGGLFRVALDELAEMYCLTNGEKQLERSA